MFQPSSDFVYISAAALTLQQLPACFASNGIVTVQAIKCSDEARHKQETYLKRVIHSMNTEAKLAKSAADDWKSVIATVEGNTPYSACTGEYSVCIHHHPSCNLIAHVNAV